MQNPNEENNEELDEQTNATLEHLTGATHEQASSSGDNPLFRPGQDAE